MTGRIPGLVPGRESVLTRSGEPVRKKMTKAPEPEDKLDATANVAVNGPSRRQAHGALPEPDARKRARPGSEGGRTQQCVRPTRPER
jgi:hypothetical protein